MKQYSGQQWSTKIDRGRFLVDQRLLLVVCLSSVERSNEEKHTLPDACWAIYG